jgi:hypothetical protein
MTKQSKNLVFLGFVEEKSERRKRDLPWRECKNKNGETLEKTRR